MITAVTQLSGKLKLIKSKGLLIHQAASRSDPTRTLTLRNAFVRDMKLRFAKLKRVIRRAIIEDDCFGLMAPGPEIRRIVVQVSFDFPRSADKVNAFITWLQKQEQDGLLELVQMPRIGQSIETAWTDKYIADSYKRGVQRARYELAHAGYSVPSIEASGGVASVMMTPFHADRLGVLYTRTFSGLKGITSAMDNQISQVLAQGLGDGDNPRLLARKMNKVISGTGEDLGITDSLGRFIPAEQRAAMLARTEIIRAHHQATVQEYRNWAVTGVTVKAEWQTAGFNVCPKCAELQGKTYTLDQIQNLIPLHPNCRCCALPVMAG